MSKVPDINASWRETFVRRYRTVDINLVAGGTGPDMRFPLLRDVGRRGLTSISQELSAALSAFSDKSLNQSIRTFCIHDLGAYGVKSAAPVILPPQVAALALGAVIDTVVPAEGKKRRRGELESVYLGV